MDRPSTTRCADARPSSIRFVAPALRAWPDDELFALARAISAELARRESPVPIALPIVEVLAGMGDQLSVISPTTDH